MLSGLFIELDNPHQTYPVKQKGACNNDYIKTAFDLKKYGTWGY